MNKEVLSEALGGIRTQYIEEAARYGVSEKTKIQIQQKRYFTMRMTAACVLLLAAVSMLWNTSFGVKRLKGEFKLCSFSASVPQCEHPPVLPSNDVDLWNIENVQYRYKEVLHVSFFGKIYKGSYEGSELYDLDWDVRNYYTGYGPDGKVCSFTVLAKTNRLCTIDFLNGPYLQKAKTLPDTVFSEKEACELAKKYASEYIETDKYEVRCDISKYSEVTVYEFEFYKPAFGFYTRDCVGVSISSKGDLVQFAIGDLGAAKRIRKSLRENALSLETVQSAIEAKIAEEYTGILASSAYSYKGVEFSDQLLVYTPEGDLVIYNRVYAILESPDREVKERITLIYKVS